jgi:YggT family protein
VGAAFLRTFLLFLLIGLQLLILARVVMSWFDPTGRSRVGAFLIQTTEPILAPIRRLLPRTGMFDFSPLLVIVVLSLILRAVG